MDTERLNFLQLQSSLFNSFPFVMGHLQFTEGDHVVYVPMFGTSSAQGVMEIYGLQTLATNNAASRAVYQRSTTVLKAMMHAKDYKYVTVSDILINT